MDSVSLGTGEGSNDTKFGIRHFSQYSAVFFKKQVSDCGEKDVLHKTPVLRQQLSSHLVF